jgi:hypothetical protein
MAGYMPFGKEGSKDLYACSRIPYCGGMIWRASFKGIGITAMVPLSVPVAFAGYIEAIGLGWSLVIQRAKGISGAKEK